VPVNERVSPRQVLKQGRNAKFKFKINLKFNIFLTILSILVAVPSYALKEGDTVPPFLLPTARGQKINVTTYAKSKQKRNLLLIFFRTGNCGICKHQLQEVADNISTVSDLNTAVLGVSLDDAIVQLRVSEEIGGKYPLLLDPDAKLVKTFDVYNPEEKLSRPSLFLIGPKGKVLYKYVGQGIQDRPPFTTVLEVLKHYSGLVLKRDARPVANEGKKAGS
jgi:peroxiredoxin